MPPDLVWLIRHGQSGSNAGLPATINHADVALTELGREQSEQVARRVERRPDVLASSPFARARASAAPIRARWPEAPFEIWPIQEFTYLSPARCAGSTAETRKPMVDDYWRRADPGHRDGPGAESFAEFVARVFAFHERLQRCEGGFVVVVGHGQFFRAYLEALAGNLHPTEEAMLAYRRNESKRPIENGEIVALRGLSSVRFDG